MKYWVFDDGMIIEVPDSAKILNIPESVLAIFEDKYGAYSAAEIIKEYNLKYKPSPEFNIEQLYNIWITNSLITK